MPDSLPGAIADRLGFVSAATREVLRAAALLGVEFAITDLIAVLGRTVTALVPALDEARATGVLTDSGSGLAFRHPLIREALYAEMPASVRAAWHRDAGHALALAGAAPDRVARQLLRAITQPTGIAGRLDLLARGQDGSSDGADMEASSSGGGQAIQIERPPVGPGTPWPTGPIDEWMLDWLVSSADSLVGQAPGVAAELLAQAVDRIPVGSARHGWLVGRLADALYRAGDRTNAEQVATRALAHTADPDCWSTCTGRWRSAVSSPGKPRSHSPQSSRALPFPGYPPSTAPGCSSWPRVPTCTLAISRGQGRKRRARSPQPPRSRTRGGLAGHSMSSP